MEAVDLAAVLGLERSKVTVGGGDVVEIRHVNELSFVARTQVQRLMGRREALFRELGVLPPEGFEVSIEGNMAAEAQKAMAATSAALSDEEAAAKASQAEALTNQIVSMIAVGPVDTLGDRGGNYVINDFLARSRKVDQAVNRPALTLGRE